MAGISPFSRPQRPGRGGALAAGLVAAACIITLAAVAVERSPYAEPRFDGEYGLWVRLGRDSVIVQWLTAAGGPGRLEAELSRGSAIVRTTPPGQAHRASFPRPRGDAVTLRYGGAGPASLTTTRIALTTPSRPPVAFRGVDSLYVVGDTHGAFEDLLTGLRRAGLINESLRWTGGRSHLVFAGDLTDRGPDVLRLLWFVYRLEAEAAQAGGRVHLVLGNHEIMVLLGDLRYVHPKELAIAEMHGVPYHRLFDVRQSVLGRWLVSKPGMLRIDGVLIAHGGVTPEFASLRLDGFDRTLAQYAADDVFYNWADTTAVIRMDSAAYQAWDDFFWHPRSVFWHREYIQSDTLRGQLDTALRLTGASTLVVGHTAVDSIRARYDGRVIAAHTSRMGAELLLLVREGRGHRRYRITATAPPQPF
jgi:hypothetical protein